MDERADARYKGIIRNLKVLEVGGPPCQQSMSVTDYIRVTALWSLPERKEESNCSKGVPVPYSDGLGKVQVQRKQDRCVYR